VAASSLLTHRFVSTVTKPGRYADGGGLYLQVRQRGAGVERLWLLRWRRGAREASREQTISLGPVRDVTLAAARDLARACRQAIARGEDPRSVRRGPQAAPTFGAAADSYVDAIAPGLRNPKNVAHWRMTLGEAYCARLRRIPVDKVGTEDVLAVLKPVWLAKPETAQRLRGRIERVLDAAKAAGHRAGDNPARWKGHLQMMLARQQSLARGHHRALPWRELPAFMGLLRARDSVSALALEFTILTAARTSETIGARWAEIVPADKVWIVPAERMKMRREHRVPLSARALKILEEARQLGGVHVFPARDPRRPLSNMAMAELLKGLAPGVTVHGFRSTFRDWIADATSYPGELAEQALAHTIASAVERAYRRGHALERRREVMAAWARYCGAGTASVVVPLRGEAAAEG